MNALTSIQEYGFAMVFAIIVLMAATPNAFEFWQKIKRTHSDMQLKLRMLKTGSSADEIVRTLMRRDFKSTTQRAG